MEFDRLFIAIQGILKSHQNSIITKFGGVNKDCDIVSDDVIVSLERVITELSLKPEQLRKINLFLLVNTELPSIPLLEDDQNFWHLLGCLPKMSPYLYFKISSELKFHNYIAEVIFFSPEFLSLEILQGVVDFLKCLSAYIAVPFLNAICDAVFHKILFLQNASMDAIIIQKYVKLFKDLISFDPNYLITDLSWGKEEKYIFQGYLSRMLLRLLTSCIKKLSGEGPDLQTCDTYDFTVNYDYKKWGTVKSTIHWSNHCLSLLVAKCAETVRAIIVDMYMAWCEEDIKESFNKTLQIAFREEAYTCQAEIRKIIHLNDEITSLKELETSLNQFALQPVTEDEEITNADADTIVLNLINPQKTKGKWLKGLLLIPGIFQSSKYMKVIQDNAHLFDLEVGKVLIDSLYQFLLTCQCSKDILETAKALFFYCIKRITIPNQLELLSYYYSSKGASKLLQRESYDSAMTMALNKISSIDDNKNDAYQDIIALCFENSERLMQILLKECLSSDLKADLLLNLLTQIKPFADLPCSNTSLKLTLGTTIHLMDSVISSLENNKDNFVQLVRKLCALGLIDGEDFFSGHIFPRLQENINKNNFEEINFYLEIYTSSVSLPSNYTVLLAFFAKSLDNMRPTITNFSVERISATSKLADIVYDLTEKLLKSKKNEDEEIIWLRSRGMELSAFSRLHMRSLWKKWNIDMPGMPAWTQEGLGLGEQLPTASEESRRNVVTATLKVLPTLTINEWYMIGSVEQVNTKLLMSTVEAVIDSILVAFQLPFLTKNLNIISHLLTNFFQFAWTKVIGRMKKGCDRAALRTKLTELHDTLPPKLQKSKEPQIQFLIKALSEKQCN